jgi:malyl-CoA/(S)-citramalyl-CoA lyase
VGAVDQLPQGVSVVVRVNPPGTADGLDDLLALLRESSRPGLQLMVPKVAEARDLQHVDTVVGALRGRGDDVGLVPLVESASAVVHLREILEASPRVTAVALGLGDLAADLGRDDLALGDPGTEAAPWDWTVGAVVVHARAAGLGAIDGPVGAIGDDNLLRRSAAHARALGYAGKLCIHPNQVALVRDVFSPSEEQLQRARRVVEAMTQAQARGEGAATIDGVMVDDMSLRAARRRLGQAASCSP